jgi:hypothetical protein
VFYSGEFRITQTRDGKRVLAVLTLVGPKPTGCPARSAVTAKGKKKKVKRRLLWGNTKGDFRTVGTYASATERGTIWLTQDQCSGTLIKVTADSVTLVDFSHHHRAVVVKAGHSFLAHPGKGG